MRAFDDDELGNKSIALAFFCCWCVFFRWRSRVEEQGDVHCQEKQNRLVQFQTSLNCSLLDHNSLKNSKKWTNNMS